jgi:hypothetical protein
VCRLWFDAATQLIAQAGSNRVNPTKEVNGLGVRHLADGSVSFRLIPRANASPMPLTSDVRFAIPSPELDKWGSTSAAVPMTIPKAYLDTCIVSAVAKDELQPADLAALVRILQRRKARRGGALCF